MNVLEKILEEVEGKRESLIDMSDDEPELCDVEEWYDDGVNAGKVKAYLDVEDIIHSHMDAEDAKKENGWIPVRKSLPKTNGVYSITRNINGNYIKDTAYFDGQDRWHNDNRINFLRPFLTDVVAWYLIPAPYHPCHGCFGAANNDCQICDKGGKE